MVAEMATAMATVMATVMAAVGRGPADDRVGTDDI